MTKTILTAFLVLLTMTKTILTAFLVLCMYTWTTAEAIKEHEGSIHWPPLKTNMSAEQVHEWNETLEYLKDALSSYEEWKEKKKSEAMESMAAYKVVVIRFVSNSLQEWLSNALQKYEEAKQKEKQQLEEYWNWLQQHRCGLFLYSFLYTELEIEKLLGNISTVSGKFKKLLRHLMGFKAQRKKKGGKNCGKTPSSTPPTSEEEWISNWKDWLHRRSSHKHHKHSTRPAHPHRDEMQKYVEDFFHRFREESALGAKEDGNDTETSMKQPAFRDLSPIIVPPGNYTTPTVPAQVVYTRWWNDPWFWVIHVIGVLIIVVLAVAVCAMRMQKKKDYQRLA
uniref:DUF148 domain-containing protein n=1 Tax=Ascaris lumbricoides TaxID=6252 RepID=A0A0M3HZF5_ASCLU